MSPTPEWLTAPVQAILDILKAQDEAAAAGNFRRWVTYNNYTHWDYLVGLISSAGRMLPSVVDAGLRVLVEHEVLVYCYMVGVRWNRLSGTTAVEREP